jgi:hypothetical protein
MGKVLHASYSGYFPTCTVDQTPTPSQNYLSLSLIEAMALFWRVRTWEAKASGSFYSENISSTIEYTSSSCVDMTPTITIGQEEDLVCKGEETFAFQRLATAIITPDGGDPFNTDGTIDFQFIFASIAKGGSTYYPSFFIASINALTSLVPTFGSKIGTYKITYSGFQIVGDLFGPDGSSGSALIEIEAKQYWSYGGTYNTSTGEPL